MSLRAGGPAPPEEPEQPVAPYLDAVTAYGFRGSTRFHIPGHKGGVGADPGLRAALGERALLLDIPQDIRGIDLGPSPTPYERAERLAAEAYGAEKTWFLTNGATQGNHALCLALAPPDAAVVLQRNSHASLIDGLVLSGGAVADVRGLSDVAHEHGVPLVVDEAWGAHLAFHDELPQHALAAGADLVVSSTHKIVGSLTQSAIVHLGHGSLLDEEMVDRAVTLVESTSPSSLSATSSIADCVRLPTILCVEATIASAPSRSGVSGSAG